MTEPKIKARICGIRSCIIFTPPLEKGDEGGFKEIILSHIIYKISPNPLRIAELFAKEGYSRVDDKFIELPLNLANLRCLSF
jgi:hypothetical protein